MRWQNEACRLALWARNRYSASLYTSVNHKVVRFHYFELVQNTLSTNIDTCGIIRSWLQECRLLHHFISELSLCYRCKRKDGMRQNDECEVEAKVLQVMHNAR